LKGEKEELLLVLGLAAWAEAEWERKRVALL
jgi:hypothetical protein